jgi:hypothetical protein
MNWTIETTTKEGTDKAGYGKVVSTTVLFYRGQEMMRKEGPNGRQILHDLAEQYNASGKTVKLGPTCMADLEPKERDIAIRKLADNAQDALPLILSPDENRAARQKWKGEA